MWRHSGHSSNPEPPAERCAVTGKIIHADQKSARHSFIGFKRRRGTHFGKSETLQTYHCSHCGGYHNGHRPPKQNSRNDKRYRGR
jgi:hypothetical protein